MDITHHSKGAGLKEEGTGILKMGCLGLLLSHRHLEATGISVER